MNNNKKFRKSTIVIPALALMVLTAGASATGAVAWFTATRQVDATASTFTAASTTAALVISTTAGKGTTTTSTSDSPNGTVSLGTSGSENYLCDASFDASSGKLYHSVLNDEGTVESFAVIDTSTEYSYDTGKKTNDGSHSIFYAVDWTYTFTYSTTNPKGSALLFDRTSTFSETTGLPKGFRIAFVNTTDSNKPYRIWSNDATKTYVNGTATASTSTYGSTNIFQNDSSYSRITDSSATSTTVATLPEYLGTFTSGSGAVTSIALKCTAWYEGTDSAVVNSNLTTGANRAITANMKFYVRDLA
ncbi:MAG: hypothetical protein PUA93_00430 [Eubacteriales bacterium]|nr:hypothetical protein [Eubacteriales bacterium]